MAPVFLTGGVFESDIAHRRSLSVLCLPYKIRCNRMLPHYDALPVPYVPVRITHGALVAHRYTYAPPRCITSLYPRTFIPLSVSLCGDLADSILNIIIIRWCGTGGFLEQGLFFFIGVS